mmetsp:Transcript_36622/g.50852  ORF Transcript_36622/g.50852 Transcript_36622/m.50852 type:complete len:234 (-) Transcript_36622:549-1250(-)
MDVSRFILRRGEKSPMFVQPDRSKSKSVVILETSFNPTSMMRQHIPRLQEVRDGSMVKKCTPSSFTRLQPFRSIAESPDIAESAPSPILVMFAFSNLSEASEIMQLKEDRLSSVIRPHLERFRSVRPAKLDSCFTPVSVTIPQLPRFTDLSGVRAPTEARPVSEICRQLLRFRLVKPGAQDKALRPVPVIFSQASRFRETRLVISSKHKRVSSLTHWQALMLKWCRPFIVYRT